jgi:hypothetical protein
MAGRQATLPRAKISATVDPLLLQAVDEYVRAHPGLDRSTIIDEALALWYAREQEHAMAAQFAAESEVDQDEWGSWRAIRRAAATRRIAEPRDEL